MDHALTVNAASQQCPGGRNRHQHELNTLDSSTDAVRSDGCMLLTRYPPVATLPHSTLSRYDAPNYPPGHPSAGSPASPPFSFERSKPLLGGSVNESNKDQAMEKFIRRGVADKMPAAPQIIIWRRAPWDQETNCQLRSNLQFGMLHK